MSKDHLGHFRAVINRNKNGDGQADVAYYSDYYPYGTAQTLANNDYRYGYQGKYAEVDKETECNNFDFRMYDAQIGRWMSTDPMGEFWSPYTGMGNNPISTVDPDGGCTDCPNPKEPTYKGNGGKALNEVTITAQRLNGYGRMGFRTELGFDPHKFMNGKPDYEAMYTFSTYAAIKKPEDLQEYLIDGIMLVDGAEIGYLLVKFVGKGSITLAGKYMLKQAIKNPVNTERELEVLATTTHAGVKALMKGKGIDRAFREIADKNVIIKLAQKLKILKVNSLTKGADMDGLNLLGEYWSDVTTMKDWTKHTVKYGSGGKGLFY